MIIKGRKIIGIISFMNAAGAQEALLRLSRQMRSRGHEMEVWFLYQEDSIHQNEPYIRVFYKKSKLNSVEYIVGFVRLTSALVFSKPDVVVGFLPLGNVFGLTAAFLAGVKGRIASQRAPGNTFGRVMGKLDRILGSTRVYGKIVCVSEAVKNSFAFYPSTYQSKLSVIHNGIEWLPSRLTKQASRKLLSLPQDAIIFAAVGRIKAQKNYAFLFRALAKTQNVTLAVAGDGEQRDALISLASELGILDRVIFLGALAKDAVRELLNAADVFIQASLYEGQSNAVLEAMHQGLPIVVSDIPEQRETVVDSDTNEKAAILVSLDDVDAWAIAIEQISTNQDFRAELATAAKSLVARRFGLSRMTDSFEQAIISANPN